jgi:hypothetical protein
VGFTLIGVAKIQHHFLFTNCKKSAILHTYTNITGAIMRRLTLAQALQFNNAKIKTNRQSTKQLKNWYAEGYKMKANGTWLCTSIFGGRDSVKYYTGN